MRENAGREGLPPGNGPIIGVDIGGTTMSMAEVLPDGTLSGLISMPSPARTHGRDVVARIREAIEQYWPTASKLGVGTAGVIDPTTGSIVASSDSFHGWTGFPLRQALSDALGIPVSVENDVNAFLLGEQRFGAAQGARSCLGVMLGTGVGGAVILNDQILPGQHGAAAEIGHMPVLGEEPCSCGTPGHLESLAAGRSIARRYLARKPGVDAGAGGAKQVYDAANAGDPIAQQVFQEAGYALGVALVQAATLFDLDTVVLGGSVIHAWRWLEPGISDALARFPLISQATLHVATSELGEQAVLLGAASGQP